MSDLTTVAAVRLFNPNLGTGNLDALIARLIQRESEEIRRELGAVVPFEACSRALNGTGTRQMTLPSRPVISVASVAIDGVAVAQSTGPLLAGWRFDGRMTLVLNGRPWPMGLMNVDVAWDAGYAGTFTQAVPTGNTPVITPTGASVRGGWAAEDNGVTYANGSALTAVTANQLAGQYSYANGSYAFNSGDANAAVTIAFHYVPGPIEQACIEMVGLDLSQRGNQGMKSQAIGDQSTVYELRGLTPSVKEMLAPFKQVAPLT